jgi:hypothetical protein
MSVDPSVAVGDRIVVGVDGSGSSQQALRSARFLAHTTPRPPASGGCTGATGT